MLYHYSNTLPLRLSSHKRFVSSPKARVISLLAALRRGSYIHRVAETDPPLWNSTDFLVVVDRTLPPCWKQSVNVAAFFPLLQSLNGLLTSLLLSLQVPRPKLSLSSWKMSRTFRMGSFADTIGFDGSPAVSPVCWKMSTSDFIDPNYTSCTN